MQSTSSHQPTRPSDKVLDEQVRIALAEDIGSGDITAALIPPQQEGQARVITREPLVLCGQAWVDAVFRQLNPCIQLDWRVEEGAPAESGQTLFELKGPLRDLLTGERCALNFLQTLSGTATTSRHYADRVRHTRVKLLDTRKTIPGLRLAQKYAVATGGCFNHRLGLYDAFLIKENHITACGSIAKAIHQARQQAPGKPVEVEVENGDELAQAIEANADTIMLDNFSLADMVTAVQLVRSKTGDRCRLEASGGVNDDNLVAIAETGVDYISIGALTKHVRAIDLSMRVL